MLYFSFVISSSYQNFDLSFFFFVFLIDQMMDNEIDGSMFL